MGNESSNLKKHRPMEGAQFEALFARYYIAVLALFRHRGFGKEESEDLTQETFLKVYEKLATYRGEAPIKHWLFRIASNTAKANIRFHTAARRAADEVPLEEIVASHRERSEGGADPLHSLLSSECSEQLLAAVERLPPRMHSCVRLLLEQDFCYREIAEDLRISEQTVKVHLLRARARLRRILKAHRGLVQNASDSV